jgi:formylglycine-generating enzyme required for sulfatase activity
MIYKHIQTLTMIMAFMFVMIANSAGHSLPLSTGITPTPTPIAPGTIATDGNGFEMVFVPAGEYEMGATEEDYRTLCEETFKGSSKICSDLIDYKKEIQNLQKRRVKVSEFWIDRYEITIAAYQPCTLTRNSCRAINNGPNPKLDDDPQKPQYGVTWYDAMYFCNRRIGRLPTEVEWEYAARGPENRIFPWGNTYHRAYLSPSDATYPVGSVPENKSWIGAFDMAGNIAEWTEDRVISASQIDDTSRIVRGGSWGNQTTQIATFDRAKAPADAPDSTVGFRCIRGTHPNS